MDQDCHRSDAAGRGLGSGERATVVPLRPHPDRTRVVQYPGRDGTVVTAIYRRWKPGDSGPAGRCRLCPVCTAEGDDCMVAVDLEVDEDSAPLFDARGLGFLLLAPADDAPRTGHDERAGAGGGRRASCQVR